MNWPNRLSLIRIGCVPVITLLMVLDNMAWTRYAALFLFIAAAITDFVLSWHGLLPAWMVVAILFRELAVDGLRLVAVEQGRVIAAGKLGKIKTVCQITMVITHLVAYAHFPLLEILAGWLMLPTQLAVLAMTLWSGVDYFIRNKEVLHG